MSKKYEVHVQTSFIRSLVVEAETEAEAIEFTKAAFALDGRQAVLIEDSLSMPSFELAWEFDEDPDTYVIGEVP